MNSETQNTPHQEKQPSRKHTAKEPCLPGAGFSPPPPAASPHEITPASLQPFFTIIVQALLWAFVVLWLGKEEGRAPFQAERKSVTVYYIPSIWELFSADGDSLGSIPCISSRESAVVGLLCQMLEMAPHLLSWIYCYVYAACFINSISICGIHITFLCSLTGREGCLYRSGLLPVKLVEPAGLLHFWPI